MSYEGVEKDSLLTLRYALGIAIRRLEQIKSRESGAEQMLRDMKYELERIDSALGVV